MAAKKGRSFTVSINLSVSICFILLVICNSIFTDPTRIANHTLEDYIEIIPVMLATSLSGAVAGSMAVLLFFIEQSVAKFEFALTTFLLLMASLVANLPIIRHWYKKLSTTILAALVFALVLGNGWSSLLLLTDDLRLLHPAPIRHFFSALPSCAFVAFFCYFFFKAAPPKVRNFFLVGYQAQPEYEHLIKEIRRNSPSSLSFRITAIIAVETIITGICTTLLAIRLGTRGGPGPMPLEEIFRSQEPPTPHLPYVVKMVMLSLNVTVPLLMFVIANINRYVTTPICLMAKAMNDFTQDRMKMAKNSVLDIHLLHINTHDELEDLYHSLVNMANSITSYITKLEYETQLENDLAIAKAANRAKSAFLSNMSHEIRTPINAVLGLDEMIIRETKETTTKGYAIDIQNAGKSLVSLVNDILDFSKIEAGKMEIIPTDYDVGSLMNDLVNMISHRAQDKNLELNVSVKPDIPHLLHGDEIRIKQCLLNILTNAVKYTMHGSVSLSLDWQKKDEHSIILTAHVVDTGIGIKEEDIPRLFTAFQRLEEERNRTIEGTGLGINIVKQLLELMGSSLHVHSVYGEGSDFFFHIEQTVVDWEAVGDFEENYRHAKDTVDYKESFHAPDAHILVVDDTPLNLTVVKGLLKQTQIQIDTAKSGEETLELVQKRQYDVIFIDHRMPGMDGIETLHAMERLSDNKNKEVPCIALTANAISGAREMYLAEGFTDYLTKPIVSKKLEKMLLQYLPASLVEKATASVEAPDAESEDIPVTGIQLAVALEHCGSREVLVSALKDFYAAIDTNSRRIERFAETGDYKNYTVLVHALKSSARLIGAEQLSAEAAHLEKCGDANDEAEILEKTPALLRLYRSYREHLAPLAASAASNAGKPPLSLADYQQALHSVQECLQAFDVDTADKIIADIDSCRLPDGKEDEYAAIKAAVTAVDYAEALALLGKVN